MEDLQFEEKLQWLAEKTPSVFRESFITADQVGIDDKMKFESVFELSSSRENETKWAY